MSSGCAARSRKPSQAPICWTRIAVLGRNVLIALRAMGWHAGHLRALVAWRCQDVVHTNGMAPVGVIMRDWQRNRDMWIRVLEKRTGEGLSTWNRRVTTLAPA